MSATTTSNAAADGLRVIVDLARYPLHQATFLHQCRRTFDATGVLVMDGFIQAHAISDLVAEAVKQRPLAYFTEQVHTVYLEEPEPDRGSGDARSWPITSTKGAVTTDQVPADSGLRTIYDSQLFRRFLASILGEAELFPYADSLSSININYYETGQELGWHFDNSSFSITLLTQHPEEGGQFEYITGMRDTTTEDQNYGGVAETLRTGGDPRVLNQQAGDLVIFRGRETLHRVTPVRGIGTRILSVFAYNTEPDLALSEHARMTFFGRLGLVAAVSPRR